MSSFIDSGTILYYLAISNNANIYNCEANDLGVVMCSYNKWTNRLRVYRCLLTNHLHDKAAELCLANSWNNSITTTKYIEYINSILLFLSRGVGKVLL